MTRAGQAVQTGARLLAALAAVIGSIALFRLLLMPAAQAVFHLNNAEASLLRRGGILFLALLAYWSCARLLEKREVKELAVRPAGIALGVLSGASLISITTLTLFCFGIYEVKAFRGVTIELGGVAFVILIAAMLEEIVFRGILFRILERPLGTIGALCVQSLIFSVVHLSNVSGAGALTIATTAFSVALIGTFWAMIFVHSRNLWVIGTHHAAWNFSILLTGLPLSGVDEWRGLGPFDSLYRGPDWLSGGVFGPENSVITFVVVGLCLAALFYRAQQKGLLKPPERLER